MTPAGRLLVACAAENTALTTGQGVDWAEFLELASRHGLQALAHRVLEGSGVPPEAARSLWMASVERRRCNAVLSRELARVATALEGHGISCIPFKGPTLSVLAYGDSGVREFGDLDVLVRPRDVPAARRVLEGLGYRPEYAIAPHAERALLDARKHYDIVLRGEAGNVVELHWRTDADFPVEQPDDAWWAGRPRVAFEGATLHAFTPTELMLVLLLHGSKHHWTSLQWLADVAALTRREAIDWHWIVMRAGALHCRRRLALGAILLRDLLGAAVPETACATAPRIAALAAALSREAFEPEREATASTLLIRNFALYDRAGDAMRNAFDAVFAPTFADWTRWRLPAGLAFLYFPLRLARLCCKYTLAAIRSLRPRSRIGATLRTPPPRPHSRG